MIRSGSVAGGRMSDCALRSDTALAIQPMLWNRRANGPLEGPFPTPTVALDFDQAPTR